MGDEVTQPQQQHSNQFEKLFAALAAAQGVLAGAAKDKTNPHFRSAYADLASVWEACRGPLSKNGLSVVQLCSAAGAVVTVRTILGHSSGQWIAESLSMRSAVETPQGIGSCITYARRYALAAMVGVAPEDDDGNAASGTKPAPAAPRPAVVESVYKPKDEQVPTEDDATVRYATLIKALEEIEKAGGWNADDHKANWRAKHRKEAAGLSDVQSLELTKRFQAVPTKGVTK